MRILVLARSLEIGGTERQIALLAAGMRRRGHDLRVATFYPGGALEDDLREAGVPLVSLGKRSRWDLAGSGARLLRTVRRSDPHVLLAFLVAPHLVSALLRPVLPRTRIVWSLRASDMDLTRYDLLSRMTFALSTSLARHADLLLVNSRAGMRYHAAQGFPRERMRWVPNGIDVARFRPDRGSGEIFRRSWCPDPAGRLVGIVGRLDPMKDPLTFLRAAQRLANADRSVRFVWIGPDDGPLTGAWKTHPLAARLGRALTWAGPVADMPAAYNALDALVLSSSTEGFPNVVGEAMACGIPCAVTDVGDAAEIVGPTGAVAPPRDPLSLAEALARLLSAGPSPPRPETREWIVDRYAAGLLLDRTERLLRNLAGEEAA